VAFSLIAGVLNAGYPLTAEMWIAGVPIPAGKLPCRGRIVSNEAPLAEVIASSTHGVLATTKRSSHPQLSNVLYLWDGESRIARISTTDGRVKARNLRRNPNAALYVAGSHFWSYAVGEGTAELSDVSTSPGDAAGRELLELSTALMGPRDEDEFFERMVADNRLVIRLHVDRLYGLVLDRPPGS
jgi:PPOX class probable F420-dependent enzyme